MTTGNSGSHNTHARLSPSSSKRWTTCTASVPFCAENADKIEDRSSDEANEGTQAHDLSEQVLTGRMQLEDVPDEAPSFFRRHIKTYVDACLNRIEEAPEGSLHFVEAQVPLFYQPDEKGTADFVLVTPQDTEPDFDSRSYTVVPPSVTTLDLKYGQGVYVEPEENDQLIIYTLSVIKDLESDGTLSDVPWIFPDDTTINIGIVQPRHHQGPPVRIWTLTLAELRVHGERIQGQVDKINSGFTDFAPSEDACRWCPAKRFCAARENDALASLGPAGMEALAMLPDLSKEDLKASTAEDRIDSVLGSAPIGSDIHTPSERQDLLVRIWKDRKKIERFLDDIEEELYALANQGTPAPGTKLVQGRPGNRRWADEEAADKLLRRKLKADERYVRKLVSPTVAAELLDIDSAPARTKTAFEKLVSRSDGKPTLALLDDKRPALENPLDGLDDLTENTQSQARREATLPAPPCSPS